MSRLDVPVSGAFAPPEAQRVGGVAFAGARGVQAVELSADDGHRWSAATLLPPLAATTWVLWTAPWQPGPSGLHTLAVRAWDGAGAAQIAEHYPPLPDGASGVHKVTVRVT